MGGSSSSQNYDPAFNAGILALSQEQQGWAGEYLNFYKYGVTYDPNEQGYTDPKTGDWVPLSEAPHKINHYMGTNVDLGPDIPKGAEVTTRGASEGYDFNNPPTSYMSVEQAQLDANQQMIPSITNANINASNLESQQAITGIGQTWVDRALLTGVNEGTGERVGPGALAVGGASQTRDLATIQADTRLIPYSESATRQQYLTQGAQSASDRAVIPYSQGAAISGYNYQTAMNQAQQGLISPWVESVLSDYQYNTAKNKTEQELLPGYQKATQSGYDLTYDKNTADRTLVPAYQKAAQAEYDLSYDTSQYGRQKIAGQTPIMNRYFDTVNKGIDVGGRVNQASADVAASWNGSNQRTNMALEGVGIDPSSNRGRDAYSKSNMEYGRQLTTARQTARNNAENEDINRMTTALNM